MFRTICSAATTTYAGDGNPGWKKKSKQSCGSALCSVGFFAENQYAVTLYTALYNCFQLCHNDIRKYGS